MHAATHLATILVVEDRSELVTLLEHVLGEQGYAVRSALDGDTGLASALENEPDLLILDIGLPNRSGLEVVQELRRNGVKTPTLMLTALDGVDDRVRGLEAGADDYLVKPFDTAELVARVRALLRRCGFQQQITRLRVGDVVLDPVERTACRAGRELRLTPREFSLLEYFMRHVGRPLSRTELGQQVWDRATVDLESNLVDAYVAYLRKKLDVDGEPPMLITLRNVGYVLRQ
jgi:two-component system OmpR family response regulator